METLISLAFTSILFIRRSCLWLTFSWLWHWSHMYLEWFDCGSCFLYHDLFAYLWRIFHVADRKSVFVVLKKSGIWLFVSVWINELDLQIVVCLISWNEIFLLIYWSLNEIDCEYLRCSMAGCWRRTVSPSARWMAPGGTAAPPWCPAPRLPQTCLTWRRIHGSSGDASSTTGTRSARRKRNSWK